MSNFDLNSTFASRLLVTNAIRLQLGEEATGQLRAVEVERCPDTFDWIIAIGRKRDGATAKFRLSPTQIREWNPNAEVDLGEELTAMIILFLQ